MNHISKISELKKECRGYLADRLFSQLEFAVKLSGVNDGRFDQLISYAVDNLESAYQKDKALTKDVVADIEGSLSDLSPHAKKLTMMCVSHAHIDMNWMWDYSETVAITLGTFRTMLNLMDEYPDFTFSQSQASVYRIVEKHDSGMLEEIKARVKEGRWEVAASTWVEADKNMPNGESHARHILYTKRYLTKLLDLPPDALLLDYEPDTFGHNRNVPEILAKGGVKYYYHCRGYNGHNIYKWKSPSGKQIIVYREPIWYNLDISPDLALHVPEFCKKHHMDSAMIVYGVGDHGGGPTRKDIERLIDMDSWPVFPAIRFGTYRDYFKKIEDIEGSLPVVEGELNFVFTGCYTTQGRIKTSNRVGEAKLGEAEAISSLSSVFANGNYPAEDYEKCWRKVLFNQFHDILPGSGVIETREYAMGEFQKVLAYTNTGIEAGMNNIAAQIDTASLKLPDENLVMTRSEGGGVGFEMGKMEIPHPERGTGLNRIIHLFNPTQFKRKEIAEILVWDWEGDTKRVHVTDSSGKRIEHQLVEFNSKGYWAHTYMRLLIEAEVPPYGYSTYVVSQRDKDDLIGPCPDWPRLERPDEFVLENDLVKAAFDSETVSLDSLIDKKTGLELIAGDRSAGFRHITEDSGKGMTAWVVGRYMDVSPLETNARVTDSHINMESLKQWIVYEQAFKSSSLKVKISLEKGSALLKYEVECDWQERAVTGKSIPQLNFQFPVNLNCNSYKYDIPFGTIERVPLKHDVPGLSWMAAVPDEGDRSAMLMTKTKYGFRGTSDVMSLTLLRSSYDPDPYPDNGIHNICFAVAPVSMKNDKALVQTAYEYNHPVSFISGWKHTGTLTLDKSFIDIKSGSAVVSALKVDEDTGTGLVVRLYETEGADSDVVMSLKKAPRSAHFVDLHEKEIDSDIQISGNEIKFVAKAYNIESILIKFN